MRRAIAAVALLVSSLAVADMVVPRRPMYPPAGGGAFGDISFWFNAETNDTTSPYTMGGSECSDGDNAGDILNSWTIDTGSLIVGTHSAAIDASTERLTFDISAENIISGTAGRVGVYLRVTTWASGAGLWQSRLDGSNLFGLQMQGTDELRFAWSDGGVADEWTTTNADLVTGTNYFIEVEYDPGTDALTIYRNGTALTTSLSGDGAFAAQTDHTALRVGEFNGVAATYFMDNFMTSDSLTRDFHADGLFDDTTKPTGACDG